MSVVVINALEVPDERGAVLEERFANRAGEVEQMAGFEGFDLLRPTDGSNRWFVVTRWASQEHFDAWVASERFTQGHAATSSEGPAATGSEILQFEVVLHADPATA